MSRPQMLRQRAIATGLSPFLDSQQLPSALQLWQRDYADQPSFTLQRFVSEVCLHFGLRERRQQIHLSLVQAMSLPETALLPLPANDARAPAVQASHGDALQALLHCLWQQQGPDQEPHLRQQMLQMQRQHLPGNTLSSQQRLALEQWLQSAQSPLPELPLVILRQLLNLSYVQLCEQLGPVQADSQLKCAFETCRVRQPALKACLDALL